MAQGHGLSGSPGTGRVGAARAGYAGVLCVLEVVLALIGWTAGVDHGAGGVVLRWSAPVGAVLMLVLLLAAGTRRVSAVRAVALLAAVRVVVVAVVVFAVGSDDANGRSDPSFLILAVLGIVVALAGAAVAASVLSALGPGRPTPR